MDIGTLVIIALVILAVLVVAYRMSPKFRNKANKYVDKNGNGKPFG